MLLLVLVGIGLLLKLRYLCDVAHSGMVLISLRFVVFLLASQVIRSVPVYCIRLTNSTCLLGKLKWSISVGSVPDRIRLSRLKGECDVKDAVHRKRAND
jgi:hypothetical protein